LQPHPPSREARVPDHRVLGELPQRDVAALVLEHELSPPLLHPSV
jgi:hypothetical protein